MTQEVPAGDILWPNFYNQGENKDNVGQDKITQDNTEQDKVRRMDNIEKDKIRQDNA